MTFFKWSRTAGDDATADSTINWAEGQAPSSINDSARAMMAATAKYRDDITGAIVTAGTSTAYTVASYQVFDTLAHLDGQVIAFTPHATNGATVTLNVDSLGAKPLRSEPSTELLAGTLIQGTPYIATYNNSDAAFYLRSFFGNPYNVPLGAGLPFFGTTAPNSAFVFPFGQAISRSTYSALFALTSTTYGVGDGSTTFNLPDLRGRVPGGKDDMGGSAASRLTASSGMSGSGLGATGGVETVTLDINQIPSHNHTLHDSGHSHAITQIGNVGNNGNPSAGLSGVATQAQTQSATTGITIDAAGGGLAHVNIQPTLVCNYIVRII